MADSHQHKSAHEQPKPSDVMGMLQYYLVTKAPYQLPTGAREWLVQFLPWIELIILLLLAPAILVALGVGAALLPFGGFMGAQATAGLSLALIALVVTVGLTAAALPGLFARKMVGWNLAFYGVVFSLIHDIVNFNLVGGLVSAVLSSYVLFQIRSYYK